MSAAALAKTASRQVLGVMNEFTFMAEHSIHTGHSAAGDLPGLSCWLADTIVGPLQQDDGYRSVRSGVSSRAWSLESDGRRAAIFDHSIVTRWLSGSSRNWNCLSRTQSGVPVGR